MKDPLFQGSCTAMITPFTESGIDLERMGLLIDWQAENGTKAIVVAGTTGEAATLEPEEFESLVSFSVRRTAGRMKTIVGIGGNHTEECLRKARLAACAGADAVLMTPPYYNKTSPGGLEAHFRYVADRSELPLILYNVPGRTAIGISMELYRLLAEHPNIIGVKEASGDVSLAAKLTAELGEKLFVWSGNDDLTLPLMALGAQGVVSVVSNLEPNAVSRLCSCCLNGDYVSARALQKRLSPLFSALFIETNPIPIKAAMELRGLDSGRLRLPLLEISDVHRGILKKAIDAAAGSA